MRRSRDARPTTTDPLVGPLVGTAIAVVNWRDLGHRLAGGSERYAWEFALALREAGARVDFVTSRDAGQTRRDVREGIDIHRGGGAFGFYAFAASWLLRHRRQLDLVIDPECGIPSFSPLWLPRTTPIVMVMHHVHQAQFATYFRFPLTQIGQWLERVATPRLYRRATTVAVSASTREEMREQLGWRGEVGLLTNGTEVPDASRAAPVVPDHKDLDRIVAFGRLVPHKRVDLVVRTLADLAAERPTLRLDVVGAGPEREPLAALAAELGVADRVVFHGYVDDARLGELLARAALHVCASDVEGWGQTVIQAAAHGTPTVARDVPGLRDSVLDGDTGRLVPDHRDPAVVARRLTEAVRSSLQELADPETCARTVTACRAWAAGFSWSRMHAEAVALACRSLGRPASAVPQPPVTTRLPATASAAPSATSAVPSTER